MSKPRLATCSLAGCFGCHMSILDIDERILELAEVIQFHKSPITDIKSFTERCRIGLVEGGCANEENVEVLRAFRRNCDILVSVGDCATMGGIPVSTTHTITGAIVGVGSTKRLSAVRWGVAGNIIWAWILTIPISAVIASVIYLAVNSFV